MSLLELVFLDRSRVSFAQGNLRRLFRWRRKCCEDFMMKAECHKFTLRKNDQVQVIAGREKGKIGKILQLDSSTGRVTVEKTNMVKRHTRPTQKSSGGIIERELPLHYSNVLL